ncbi:unnamed protein product, partial [Rotaria magnacalcarata]
REDIHLFMKTILDTEPWLRDPSLVPIPWRSIALHATDFTVAVMWNDNVVHPHPPIIRALHETKSWDLISPLYYCNGAEEERNIRAEVNEQPLPLTEWILSQPQAMKRNWTEMNELITERENYRNRYAHIWNEREISLNCSIDCLLTPVSSSAAPQHAAVFPVTTVNLMKDKVVIDYKPRNVLDEENFKLYTSADSYSNAPIGLQVVCRRYNDEKLMKCLEIIERAMGRP